MEKKVESAIVNQMVIKLFYEKEFSSGNPKVKIKKFKYDLSFKNELHSLLETIRGINKSKKSVIKKINYESYYTLKNTILLK